MQQPAAARDADAAVGVASISAVDQHNDVVVVHDCVCVEVMKQQQQQR